MPRRILLLWLTAAPLLLYLGCSKQATEAPKADNAPPAAKAAAGGEHTHAAGAHGGHIFSIGADNYHAEVRFEQDGVVRLFMLGREETKVQEVEQQTLTAYALAEGETQSASFEIRPDPQPEDAPGKTSQFVGRLPKELWGRPVSFTVQMKIAGERFRPTFASPRTSDHAGMPKGVARGSEKERELYLTPGGIYTEQDIEANGRTVPSVKFAGISWPHDDDLKPGDKLCPVTDNKADRRCAWVVNGKTYEFCCAPCLDKFVGWAKNQPQRIKEPEDYVYR